MKQEAAETDDGHGDNQDLDQRACRGMRLPALHAPCKAGPKQESGVGECVDQLCIQVWAGSFAIMVDGAAEIRILIPEHRWTLQRHG
jgi:hypothetical protein